jgi:hypothetical protein
MPKIPAKFKKRLPTSKLIEAIKELDQSKRQVAAYKPIRVSTHKVANQLLAIEGTIEAVKKILDEAKRQVDEVWTILYTKGITDRGPISETDDDIPF